MARRIVMAVTAAFALCFGVLGVAVPVAGAAGPTGRTR